MVKNMYRAFSYRDRNFLMKIESKFKKKKEWYSLTTLSTDEDYNNHKFLYLDEEVEEKDLLSKIAYREITLKINTDEDIQREEKGIETLLKEQGFCNA